MMWFIAFRAAVSAVAVVAAAALAIYNRDGWGWFLLVALLALPVTA